jgi:hypothetical protein
MNPTLQQGQQPQSGISPEQLKQMQIASQAQQGLGTPPPPPFEYEPNSNLQKGKELINASIDKEQQAMAAKAAQANEQQGYAGYRGDPSAGVATGTSGHPNEGWNPNSPEAHQLNIQLADRIKSGTIDPRTAMIALQHNDVSPEIKQALSQIVQQTQNGNIQSEPQEVPQQGGSGGLGSVGIPQ